MPGIFGFVGGSVYADPSMQLRAMADRMRIQPDGGEELYLQAEVPAGMGRLRLTFQKPSMPRAVSDANPVGMVALIDGEIYDADEQRHSLRAEGHPLNSDRLGELFAVGYKARGQAFLRSLHGKFAAVIWDRHAQCLHMVNDRFGMRPIYFAHLQGRLQFASEIKALLLDKDINGSVNLRGIAQFFTFGQLLADDTLVDGVKLLPAASCLTYDLRRDCVTVERYWRLTQEPVKADCNSRSAALDRLDHCFAEAVRRTSSGVANLGLSLSGGLDSRTILGAITAEQPVKTVSVGVSGSSDHLSASELARLSKRQHHQCLLGTGFLERFEEHLRHMVRLTDGHYLSQCIVMPTLPVYRELGIEVLLRGHAGELMHMRKAYNFSLDDQALALRDSQSLEDWLLRRLQAYILEGTNGRLFAAPYQNHIEGLARESLRTCLGQTEGIQPPVHRIWHVFLSQRSRRETAMSLVKFGSQVETRLPYLDNELIDALFATPPEMKLDDTIQAHILRRRMPSFLKVLNVNTGAPMDAGKVGRLMGKVRHKVFAKLGVRGYQPYERLGLWLRRELRPLVQRLLLGDQCLERGLFDPATIKKVVADHFQGKNHTFLIMALMTFELGQREFVDGRSCPALPASDSPPIGQTPASTLSN